MTNTQFAQNVYEFQMEVFKQIIEGYDSKIVGGEDFNLEKLKEKFFEGYLPVEKVEVKKEEKKNEKGGNKGERGETKIIEFLFSIRNEPDKICQMFRIKSRIQLKDPSSRLEIRDIDEIKKGPSGTKADIIIYFTNTGETMYLSIKCNDGAKPTLLNHANRSCDYFQNKLSPEKLGILDSLILKRNASGKQDVKIKGIKDELNEEEIAVLVEVIAYFTFDGTGCSESKCSANSILIVNDSNNIISTSKFINCKEGKDKIEYIKSILPFLGLNMRSGRGMPGKKNHEEKMKLCEPWLFHDTKDKLCGALAIRFI